MKSLLVFIATFGLVSAANAKLPRHEFQLNSTNGYVTSVSGNTVVNLNADYAYALNEKFQVYGQLFVISGNGNSTLVGAGAKYNLQPRNFLQSYFVKGGILASSGNTEIRVGGGKRFKITQHVAYTPEGYVGVNDGNTGITVFPVAFSFSTNNLKIHFK